MNPADIGLPADGGSAKGVQRRTIGVIELPGVYAELVLARSRHWFDSRLFSEKDVLTYLCEGPCYGFRNSLQGRPVKRVADRPDWTRFLRAGDPLSTARPPGTWAYLLVFLDQGWRSALPAGAKLETRLAANLGRLSPLLGALAQLIRHTPADLEKADALLGKVRHQLLTDLLTSNEDIASEIGPEQPIWRLKNVLAEIETHLGERLSLGEMADASGFSPSHFSACFKTAMGISPHRYLLSRRLHVGRELLIEQKMDCTEVAMTTGFSSAAHFATAYKREFGSAPSSDKLMQ